MKQRRIPKKINEILSGEGITESEILYVADTDMNPEGSYRDGVVILTEQILYFFSRDERSRACSLF
ncbi:hypothetical protein [Lacrimispora sp.]|uniref:hypothetical protein n=1 Tax=Lacrimispora sp. TaxID=2719234 RepID=UPI0028AB5D86|nr:hypothetical protein [Lacrimispora sp.]